MRPLPVVAMLVGLATIAAIRLLPVWALLAALGLMVLSVVVLVKSGLPRLLVLPFKAKGAVLRDAGLIVHSVEPVATAAGDLPAYRVELSVVPREPTRHFKLWEPDDLRLVGPDARADAPEADTVAEVREVEVLHDGEFVDAGGKFDGARRLRLIVDVPPGLRALRARYYFEVFGNIPLPAHGHTGTANGRPLARAG